MTSSIILKAALALPDRARMELVERLLESFGPGTDGVDEVSFLAELYHWSEEIDQGKAELVPWPDQRRHATIVPRPACIRQPLG